MRKLLDSATEELREINSKWEKDPAPHITTLSKLYSTFAYAGRWSAQLDELAFQLT
jgi:hypothetical protein